MIGRLAAAAVVLVAAQYPAFKAPVVDQAEVVPAAVEQRVDAALNDFQARTGQQIGVAVVDSMGKQTIEEYGIGLARAWGVGTKGEDNGVLLLVAVKEKKVRIEVGRKVEGELTDVRSGQLIRNVLLPRLRQGDYGAAVEVGTQEIRRVLGDQQVGAPPATAAPPSQQPTGSGSAWPIFLFGGLALFSLIGGGRRRRRRGFGLGGPIIWGGGFGGGGFGGGGFGGGGGGGGFGGGGGGGFGGGGASGGW
jgi:uncharacterized protein